MSKKGIIFLVVLLVLGGLVAWFVLEGRYFVEGGRAPWAVINDRPDVLKEALAAGVDKEEMDTALSRATGRNNTQALEIILAAGASPNPSKAGRCYLDGSTRHGRVKVSRLLLEKGADLKLCKTDPSTMMAFVVAYGGDRAPQGEIIQTLALLMAAGGSADKVSETYVDTARQGAKKQKLDQVVAYLDNPTAPVESKAQGGEQPQGKSGSLSKDDLKQVCAGKGLSDAAPYVKQASHASFVYYFEKRYENYRWPGRGPGMPTLPKWWTSWDDPSHTQLVACVDLSEKTKARNCRYKGSGGGINSYDANIKITLYEAKTGSKVDSFSIKKTAPTCPVVKMGKKQEGLFPAYSNELKKFLAPHVGGPA